MTRFFKDGPGPPRTPQSANSWRVHFNQRNRSGAYFLYIENTGSTILRIEEVELKGQWEGFVVPVFVAGPANGLSSEALSPTPRNNDSETVILDGVDISFASPIAPPPAFDPNTQTYSWEDAKARMAALPAQEQYLMAGVMAPKLSLSNEHERGQVLPNVHSYRAFDPFALEPGDQFVFIFSPDNEKHLQGEMVIGRD